MKEQIQLPYQTPWFTAYHWKAAAGIVAKTNPTSDNWFFNECLQLMCNDRFLRGETRSIGVIAENSHVWTMPFLQKAGILNQFAKYSLHENIRAMLEGGFYINFTGVDDYYIEGKGSSHKQHINHDGILLGLNQTKKTYSLVAYKADGQLGLLEISQESFSQAFHSEYVNYQGELLGIKGLDDFEIVFDPDKVYHGIKRYIESDSTSCRTEKNLIYGIVVLNMLKKYIEMVKEKQLNINDLDVRDILTVSQHKKCMLARLQRLSQAVRLDSSLIEKYDKHVVIMAESVRMLILKYNLTHQPELLTRLINAVDHFYENEKSILGQVVRCLE